MSDSWPDRFERAGLLQRVGLLGGGAVRLMANAIDKGLDRAATIAADSKQAFERELDPNMSDARVLEEWEEPRRPPSRPDASSK